MTSLDAVTPQFRSTFARFLSSGNLELPGAARRDLTAAEAKDMYVQFKDQMDQTVAMDQIPQVDSNPEVGQITTNVLGDGVVLNASFSGSTEQGTVALSIKDEDVSSQAVAHFVNGTLVVLQEAIEGEGQPATIAAVLDPAGASYMLTHNASPDQLAFG